MRLDIKLDDSMVLNSLRRLQLKTSNLKPVMSEIGEEMLESVKKRFETSTGPDGQKWAANKESTLLKMLSQTKGNFKIKTVTSKSGNKREIKVGGLRKKGQERVSGKKPLIGESKALSGTINYRATSDSLKVGSNMIYSRVQQFGAGKGAFGSTKRGAPIPWGTIPGRPYLGFSDEDRSIILETVEKYLKM